MLPWIAGFIILIAKLGVVLLVLLLLAAYLVWLERKFLARLQIRYGPNRAGKFGLLQPIADTIKMLTKEDIVPAAADRFIFLLAPAVVATTALMMFAVVPFGSSLTLFGEKVPLVISDLNVGLLYVFALAFFFGSLRCCNGWLGLKFEIQPVGRYPWGGPDDQL
jgi:NADH-quinone oxidoreductase subunit H